MKVDFKHLEVTVSFEGDKALVDITKELGNLMMFTGSYVGDIAFEDLARTIYYSDEEVEVSPAFAIVITQLVEGTSWRACIKRAIIEKLKS